VLNRSSAIFILFNFFLFLLYFRPLYRRNPLWSRSIYAQPTRTEAPRPVDRKEQSACGLLFSFSFFLFFLFCYLFFATPSHHSVTACVVMWKFSDRQVPLFHLSKVPTIIQCKRDNVVFFSDRRRTTGHIHKDAREQLCVPPPTSNHCICTVYIIYKFRRYFLGRRSLVIHIKSFFLFYYTVQLYSRRFPQNPMVLDDIDRWIYLMYVLFPTFLKTSN